MGAFDGEGILDLDNRPLLKAAAIPALSFSTGEKMP
jgi:hypothetical protein